MTSTTTARSRALAQLAGVGVLSLALTACSDGTTAADDASGAASGTVTLVTHDSFNVTPEVLEAFEKESGLTVKTVAPGDGGALANQLVLTKDSPLGDAVYGIDNSFASRVVDAGVMDPYLPADLPASAEQYVVDDGALVPVDMGDVCINADTGWFAEHDLDVPVTLDDLAEPAYKDLLVVTNPATSSPGLAFLLATVGAKGEDGWEQYWSQLKDNGVKVVDGWEDAYSVDFTASGGDRPLALSYSSSPAFTVSDDGKTTATSALLDTCFRQVEYTGVLAGAKNPEGAKKLVDFLESRAFQEDVPGQMYVYPIDTEATIPADWATFAPLAEHPFEVSPADITAHRDEWISAWTATVVG